MIKKNVNCQISAQIGLGGGGAKTITGKYRETEAQFGDETETGEGNGESQRKIYKDSRETRPATRRWQGETARG